MLSDLLNFQGINWWTLLGGLGLNFVITIFASLCCDYLATNESTADIYLQIGPVLMVLVIFIACGLAGFIVAKIADDVPLKHAVWSCLGAIVPFIAGAVLFFNPMQFMLAGVALAGAFNGAMLAIPRPRYRRPQDRE